MDLGSATIDDSTVNAAGKIVIENNANVMTVEDGADVNATEGVHVSSGSGLVLQDGEIVGNVVIGNSGQFDGVGTIEGKLIDDWTAEAGAPTPGGAGAGTLVITGSVTTKNDATVTIAKGGELDLGGRDNAGITFLSTSELVLAHSAAFHGEVSGFRHGDRLILQDIPYVANSTQPSFNPTTDTLTVQEGGHAANIAFASNRYLGSDFNTHQGRGDFSGETVVTYSGAPEAASIYTSHAFGDYHHL